MENEVLLRERVDVVALFRPSRTGCEPVKFKRSNGREVVISEIGLRHPVTKGDKVLHVFEVTDGGADYRLEFDSQRLTWWLTMEADRNV